MKKESIKLSFIYNILYQILVLVLPLITTPYLARIIGGSNIGIYSYTQAFANYFVLLAMLGVNNYGNRSIARVRDDKENLSKTFWSIYAIQFALTLFLSIIYIIYVIVYQSEYKLIYILQIFYIASAGIDINWFFFGIGKFKITVIRNMIIKILTTIAIFIFIKSKNDLWLYTLIISIGTLISQMCVWPFLKNYVVKYFPKLCDIKQHIIPNLRLFIPVIAISLYNIMDKLMLGYISTYEEVGFYTCAEKIIQVPVTIIIALGTVMMPHISNLMANGNIDECRRLFDKGMIFVIFMSVAFAFGMANLAPIFSIWYYGSDFVRCGLFMVWLSPVIIFKSLANIVRTQFIIPAGKDNIYIKSVIIGAIVNLCINITLIPKYGGMGAIIGTVFAEFFVCFFQCWDTKDQISFGKYLKIALVFLLIGIIMYISMSYVEQIKSNLLVIIMYRFIIGVTVYISLSLVYLFYTKKNNEIINDLLNWFNNKWRKIKLISKNKIKSDT